MSVLLSTGFVAEIYGPKSFDQIFRFGCIEIYSGPQPATADAPPSGTLLARITRDGGAWAPGVEANGLEFVRSGRYCLKPSDHKWIMVGLATGVAGWCRLRTNNAESGVGDLVSPRIDGAVGLEGADATQLFLQALEISPGLQSTINHWWLAEPPIGA